MILTIIAAAGVIAAAGMLARNCLKLRTYFKGRLFAQDFCVPCKVIESNVLSVSLEDEGTYSMMCDVGNGKSVSIGLKERDVVRLQSTKKLYLLEHDFSTAKVYELSLFSKIHMSVPVTLRESFGTELDTMIDLNKKASFTQYCNCALVVVAFILCPHHSIFSIICSAASIILSNFVVPLKKWTNQPMFGIIKAEDKKKQETAAHKKSDEPVGFENWTDTEKQLYDIQQRLMTETSAAENSENPEGQNESKPHIVYVHEEAELNQTEPTVKDHSDREAEIASSIADAVENHSFRFCKECGCIVGEHALACDSCGAKLDDAPLQNEETFDQPIDIDLEPVSPAPVSFAPDIVLPPEVEQPIQAENTSIDTALESVPAQEEKPKKTMNHRTGKRKRKAAVSSDVSDMLNDIT